LAPADGLREAVFAAPDAALEVFPLEAGREVFRPPAADAAVRVPFERVVGAFPAALLREAVDRRDVAAVFEEAVFRDGRLGAVLGTWRPLADRGSVRGLVPGPQRTGDAIGGITSRRIAVALSADLRCAGSVVPDALGRVTRPIPARGAGKGSPLPSVGQRGNAGYAADPDLGREAREHPAGRAVPIRSEAPDPRPCRCSGTSRAAAGPGSPASGG